MTGGVKILLQNLHNTRDLGGYPTKDGRYIKKRCLIRSGELLKMAEDDKKILFEDYQIKTIIDFRTGMERASKPDPEYQGVENIFNSILSEEVMGISTGDSSPSQTPVDMFISHAAGLRENPRPFIDQLYRDLVRDPFTVEHYRLFFDILLEKAPHGAVLWHCSAGKDRVGIGTALLLTALGVERSIVFADYVKTNECMKDEIEALAKLAFEKTGDEQTAEAVRILDSVSEEYLIHAFEVIEDEFGTIDQYLEQEIGVDEKKKEKLQNLFLE